ncbi:MAG: FkbM family methyltransferase [Hydrogenophilales bacterium]|nr:FkbM family methyltransferase [Hydrogenophilales bacterium]
MTTWIFNVIRELLADDALETIWIDPNDDPAEIQFASALGNILAKCHHFSQRLADSADLVVYSYRDLRTAAVSYMRKFEVSGTQNLLDTWVQAGRLWLPRADIVLRYETTEGNKLKVIGKLRSVLRSKSGSIVLCRFDDGEILQRVDAEFQARQTPDEISHDSNTMILPAHRTFQPRPEDLNETERSLYAHVEHEFANWLTDHGYLHADDYGQELEYRIGRHLMRCLNAKVVVDVGVERGSFTDLACAAGVARVIGFEPLPRHFDYLAEKYADTAQVEIHPAAVSEHSGTGRLHVATDVDGRELDFHHTLSDLGDSATVIRTGKAIDVATVSLADLAEAGRIPRDIDFLKIDTDGHDLAVLRGLGTCIPESSWRNTGILCPKPAASANTTWEIWPTGRTGTIIVGCLLFAAMDGLNWCRWMRLGPCPGTGEMCFSSIATPISSALATSLIRLHVWHMPTCASRCPDWVASMRPGSRDTHTQRGLDAKPATRVIADARE